MSRPAVSRPAVSRPAVSVVMPFAGGRAEAEVALGALRSLTLREGDELVFVDNAGIALAVGDAGGGGAGGAAGAGVRVVRAAGERSPAHARNVGADEARGEWILFLDADCRPPHDLLDRYFRDGVGSDVGAVAGGVVAAPGGSSFAARYGAARSFLDQQAHLAHPYMPRAVAANLLVRRAAFDAIGGFYEGVRAAEDTDFSWRLQRAGWRLIGCSQARVEHRYRTSVRALRRQWRGYAAGRAWLSRRYDGFVPEPAVARALRRARRRPGGAGPPRARAGGPGATLRRGGYLALDAILGVEELAGLALSNHPLRSTDEFPARVVLVADRFPVAGDPLADLALAVKGARVEAAARPELQDRRTARALRIDYAEDDGALMRALALARLLLRHPVRCARDLAVRRLGRDADAPTLAALAPAVLRLARDDAARVHPLGGDRARAVAARLARLAGRPLEG